MPAFRRCGETDVGDGFGSAENREVERIKPKIGDGFAGFGHQTLTLAREREPKAAIVAFFRAQVDAADDLIGAGFSDGESIAKFRRARWKGAPCRGCNGTRRRADRARGLET